MNNTAAFNPRNTAHLAHLRTPAQGTSFYAACVVSTQHGIFIPTIATQIALSLSRATLEATATAFKG